MSIIVIIGFIWGMSALCRAAKQAAAQARVERAARARALENARRAARQAQLMEEWRQQQLATKQETARLISAERARMAQERAERIALEQARKEEEKAQKEAEKAAKREFERQQAEADLEHFAAMRDSYTNLIESMTAEAQASTTTDKRRNTLQRQILQLEEKVYKLDQRRAKAYYLAKGAC